jgi:hypothetical protein
MNQEIQMTKSFEFTIIQSRVFWQGHDGQGHKEFLEQEVHYAPADHAPAMA